jgi:dTDP-4-dehydrorhamnose reductase
MKILVLGSNGQLGLCLKDQFIETNHSVIYSSRAEIDLRDIKALKNKILLIKPDLVINAAAFTAVDNAEDHPIDADLINHRAVKVLADACNELGSCIIHISTDYVFNGTADKPYHENDITSPQGIYGESKLKGEEAIKHSGSNYLIIRTAWVFSEYGNNFLKTMLHLGTSRKELNIVGDQRGCPTYAQDIAKAIILIIEDINTDKIKSGTYHYCGDEPCTWFEFANDIFFEAKLLGIMTPEKINAVQTIDYPTSAVRPSYSVLDCSKIKNTFNINPSNWRSEIKNVIEKVVNLDD